MFYNYFARVSRARCVILGAFTETSIGARVHTLPSVAFIVICESSEHCEQHRRTVRRGQQQSGERWSCCSREEGGEHVNERENRS